MGIEGVEGIELCTSAARSITNLGMETAGIKCSI